MSYSVIDGLVLLFAAVVCPKNLAIARKILISATQRVAAPSASGSYFLHLSSFY